MTCETEHQHHHEHEHHHEAEEFPSVEISRHDQAVIGSVRCQTIDSYESGIDELRKCMQNAARMIEDAGGIIGHIKAAVHEEKRFCMISITSSEDIQSKERQENNLTIECASIIFCIDEKTLENILKKSFAEYL